MKKLLILLLFPLMMFAQDSTLIGDVDCSGEVNSQDASLILQFVTNVIDELPCEANMTGLTPEQLQEIINMMDEQLSINYSGGGGSSNYPAMISSISSEIMTFSAAMVYCADLEEDGHSDWFLPNMDQLVYALSGGCELPDDRTDNFIWTGTSPFNGEAVVSIWENEVVLNDGSTNENGTADNNFLNCRCVRFGEGETSEGSSGSSNSSGSSILGSEQPITMIGPMYLAEDFPDFSITTINNHAFELFSTEAIRFCDQLIYNDYDDWFFPSLSQMFFYFEQYPQEEIIIPNYYPSDETGYNQFLLRQTDPHNISQNVVQITGPSHNSPNRIRQFSTGSGDSRCFCVR